MKNNLLKNGFIEKDGIFIRKFMGSYVKPCEDKYSNRIFDIVENVVVSEAYIFEKNNQWFLNLYKMNPIKGYLEKEYDSLCIQNTEEEYGYFFELLLRSIYIDLNIDKNDLVYFSK